MVEILNISKEIIAIRYESCVVVFIVVFFGTIWFLDSILPPFLVKTKIIRLPCELTKYRKLIEKIDSGLLWCWGA
jgi:hypothetical protein